MFFYDLCVCVFLQKELKEENKLKNPLQRMKSALEPPPQFEFLLEAGHLAAGVLRVKAGLHAYRLSVKAPCGYCCTFASEAKLCVGDLASIETDALKQHVMEDEGEHPGLLSGSWNVLCRRVFVVNLPEDDVIDAKGALVSALVHIDEQVAPYTHLHILDNDTGVAVDGFERLPLLRSPATLFPPNEGGYTVLLTCRVPADGPCFPSGSWRLFLSTDKADCLLGDIDKKDSTVAHRYTDDYVPNKTFTLFRDVITNPGDEKAKVPAGLCDRTTSLRLELHQSGDVDVKARVKLRLIDGATQEVVAEQHGRGSIEMLALPALPPAKDAAEGEVLPSKKYILEATLDPGTWNIPNELSSNLPFIQPKPTLLGDNPADPPVEDVAVREKSAIGWTLQVSSTSAVAILNDMAQEKEWAGVRGQWEESEPGRAEKAAECRRQFLEAKAARNGAKAVLVKSAVVRHKNPCLVEAAEQEALVVKLGESMEAWQKAHEDNTLQPRLAYAEVQQKQMEDDLGLLVAWREGVTKSCTETFERRNAHRDQQLDEEAKKAAAAEPTDTVQ
jgi:hypothetical protein